MRAIDTNVVVRFLTKDDPPQAERARDVMISGAIFISNTVLLECEWVLRSAYRLSPSTIVSGLRSIIGIRGVSTERPDILDQALSWHEDGMDFADALHLAQARGCTAFLSFDRALAQQAAGRSSVPVEAP